MCYDLYVADDPCDLCCLPGDAPRRCLRFATDLDIVSVCFDCLRSAVDGDQAGLRPAGRGVGGRIRVDVEHVEDLLDLVRDVNLLDLDQVDVFEGGVPVALTPEAVARFRLTGLATKDFFALRFWEEVPE